MRTVWHRARSTTGSHVVICGNDISPRNVVFRGDEAVAFIDRDFTALTILGADLVHAVWRFAPLTPDTKLPYAGWTEVLPDRRARVDALLDGYGATPEDRAEALRLAAGRGRAPSTGLSGWPGRVTRLHANRLPMGSRRIA